MYEIKIYKTEIKSDVITTAAMSALCSSCGLHRPIEVFTPS